MARNPRPDRDWQKPWKKAEVGSAFAFTLARLEWDIFATLTFKGTLPRPAICYGMAYRWLRSIANAESVPYNHLLIALRGEEGEENGRFHFHCLVGGTSTRNNHTMRFRSIQQWKIIAGNPRVDVREYNRVLAGAEYVCKCLGANLYELNKFNIANETTLSASVYRLIAAIDASGDRRCRQHNRKNGVVQIGAQAPSMICDETPSAVLTGSGSSPLLPSAA